MVFVWRASALCSAALLGLALASPAVAKDKPALSSLHGIALESKSDDVVVSLDGTKAPDFTSFTMTDPFRVVVDWAGSSVDKVDPERSWERGLVRRILTKQFNSEAEQISRVTIELSRETAYHVEAVGTRVRIHFVPVPDPIPEPQPVAESAPEAPAKVVAQLPEGPLTEPDLPVPTELPPMPKPKAEVIAKAAPAPAPVVAVVPAPAAPAPAPVVAPAPAPAPVVAKAEPARPPAPAQPDRKETPAERQATPVTLASNQVVGPKALDKPAELPAPGTQAAKAEPEPAPVVLARVEPKPAPAPAPVPEKAQPAEKPAEPVKLATLSAPAPETKPLAAPVANSAPVAQVEAPAPAPTRVSLASTQRLASAAPRPTEGTMASGWAPPGVLPTARERTMQKKELPVVKIAQDTLQPSGSTPADPDQDDPGSTRSADANDFDPGPRVLKYVGFQQMADVSRVFVRVDGKAKYRSSKEGGSKVVLELVNTSINVKNNERPLDTTYFNSPVSKVQAVKSGDNTRIEISLREGVGFSVKRIGTTIAVDFKRGG